MTPKAAAKSGKHSRTPIRFEDRRLQRTLVGEEVAQHLLDMIGSGKLGAGDRLPAERELCQAFGVGRSSVREALRCLSIVGILDARAGAGTTVATDSRRFLNRMWSWKIATDPGELEELIEVRIALEGATAEHVALNGSAEDVAQLESLVTEMGKSLDDQAKFTRLDLDFHLSLARATRNQLLHDLVIVIRSHLIHGLERVLPLPGVISLSHREHRGIVRALKNRDGAQARRKMEAHLQAALLRYRRNTEAVGQQSR